MSEDLPIRSQPIRLLVVVGSLNRGGCERHLLQVLPAFDGRRIRTEVFVITEPGVLAESMETSGVRVRTPWIPIRPGRWLLTRVLRLGLVSLQLWLHLLIHRPDIVHFFLPASYLVGAPMAILAGVRCRLMSRRSLNRYQAAHPIAARIERLLHRWMSAIIGNSQSVVRELVQQEGVALKDAALIYNGVCHAAELEPAERNDCRDGLGIGRETFALVVVANLIPYKGHVDLLQALARASGDLPSDWVLLVVGRDDGIGEALVDLASELGVARHVRFLGERDDVESILSAADIGLLTSHEEGFPNVVLEGMAAGLPMVVTDTGGNPEAVMDGETGWVVPVGDPERLSQAIVELASNPQRRRAFGKEGRHRALERFGMESCVTNYQRLYEAVSTGRLVDELPGVRAGDFVTLDGL